MDTGGGGIDLTEDVIRDAGGIRLKKMQEGTDAYGNVVTAPKFRIPLITIGGQTFHDLVVAQTGKPEGDGPPVSNSIGRHFLHDYLVVIDYAGSSITLWPPDASAAAAACGVMQVPMRRTIGESHLAVGKFTTPSGPLKLLWDTGATWSTLTESVVKDRHLPVVTRGQTSFYSPKVLSVSGQEFGPLEFVVQPVRSPAGVQGFIGANFFSNHVVCLDYRKGKSWFVADPFHRWICLTSQMTS